MFIVGLTGGIGSGKSTVAKMFARRGVSVIDADVIARKVMEPGTPAYQAVVTRFGQDIVADDNQIDRQALKRLIFTDSKQRQALEAILHPVIIKRLQQQAQQATSTYCIMVIPLLLETNLQTIVDRVLVIDVAPDTQIKRASLRDASQTTEVLRIMNSQTSRTIRLAAADDIINNDGGLDELERQVDDLHQRYIK